MGRGGFPVYTRTRFKAKKGLYKWHGRTKKPYNLPQRARWRDKYDAMAGTRELMRLLYSPVPRTLPSSPHLVEVTLRPVGLYAAMGEGKTSNCEVMGNVGTWLWQLNASRLALIYGRKTQRRRYHRPHWTDGIDPAHTQKIGTNDIGHMTRQYDGSRNTIANLKDAGETLSGRHGGMSRKRELDLTDYSQARHKKNIQRLKVSPHDPSGLFLMFLDCQYYKLLDVVIRGTLYVNIFKGVSGSDAEMGHFKRLTHWKKNEDNVALNCLVDITDRRGEGDKGANGEGVWISKAGHCGHMNLRHMFELIRQPLWEYTQAEYDLRDSLWYAEHLGVLHGFDLEYKPDELHLMLWRMDPRPPIGSFGLIKQLYRGLILEGMRNGTLSEAQGVGGSQLGGGGQGAIIAEFHSWVRERCRLVPDVTTRFSVLWTNYQDYKETDGLGRNAFARALLDLKLKPGRDTEGETIRHGIMLSTDLVPSLD